MEQVATITQVLTAIAGILFGIPALHRWGERNNLERWQKSATIAVGAVEQLRKVWAKDTTKPVVTPADLREMAKQRLLSITPDVPTEHITALIEGAVANLPPSRLSVGRDDKGRFTKPGQ